VFDPLRTTAGERLRARLDQALEPDGPCARLDEGPLSLAWTQAVAADRGADGGSICLLDGHLYNRSTLAAELGVHAEIGTVALLTQGFAALGTDLLAKLRGDFALVLWDRQSRTGLIARDQLGGRGLFVRRLPHGIGFATEVRNLTRLLPRAPAPDAVAVAHWLVPAVIPENRTIYEGVEAVAPATFLSLGEGEIATRRYWRPRYRHPGRLSVAAAGEQVHASLRRAVERRAGPADSSAVLLSGGIDSASVAGIAAAGATGLRPGRSYSAVFPGHPEIDEGPLIGSIAAHTGLRATGLRLDSGGLLSGALPFIEAWGLLPPTPNLFFLHPLLQRAASDGTRVLLDGEGGDAIFWYSTALLAERVRRGRFLSAWSLAGRFPEYGVATSWRTRLRHLRQWGRRRDFSPSHPQWLRVDPSLLEDPPAPEKRDGPAWWSAQAEGILGPGSRMLHDTSRQHAALSGIEPRHPLLDVDLIELALSFPPELAFDRRYSRPILREAVQGLVPDGARLRPYKSNFDPVLISSLDADLPAIQGLLLAPEAEIGAYVERRELERYLSSPPATPGPRREWALTVWHLATTECWLRLLAGRNPLPKDLQRELKPAVYSFVQI
jgi:asparagine synthase (glutamine-hydrolysing)